MTRQDLGFVISRALAVWLLVTVVPQLITIAEFFFSRQRAPANFGYPLVELGTELFICAVAWFLWFKADAFAGSGGETTAGTFDAQQLKWCLFAAIGLWFLLSALVRFATWAGIMAMEQGVGSTLFGLGGPRLQEEIARGVLGLSVLLYSSSRIRAYVSAWLRPDYSDKTAD